MYILPFWLSIAPSQDEQIAISASMRWPHDAQNIVRILGNRTKIILTDGPMQYSI